MSVKKCSCTCLNCCYFSIKSCFPVTCYNFIDNEMDYKTEKIDSRNTLKRKRISLSLQQKVDILNKFESGITNKQLSTEYGLNVSTITTVLQNKDKVRQRYKQLRAINADPTKMKRIVSSEFETLDNVLNAWLFEMKKIGEPVTGEMIKEQAKKYHKELIRKGEVPDKEFKGSSRWLMKFKERNGLRTSQIKQEKMSGNRKANDAFINDLTSRIVGQNYSLDDVYNVDETGLMYRNLPDRTIFFEIQKDISVYKQLKDRLTVVVCANASGTHRIPLLVIGRYLKPNCFRKIDKLPLEYINQTRALMTKDIFLHWFQNIFLKSIRPLKPHARVILLLDNSSIHLKNEELNQIDNRCIVIFFPYNVSNFIQPMKQDIFPAMKKHYKTRFLRDVLSSSLSTNYECIQYVKKWSILKCMFILQDTWNSIELSTLRKSWRRLIPNLFQENIELTPVLNNELLSLINHIPQKYILNLKDITKWLEEDKDLAVCDVNDSNLELIFSNEQSKDGDMEDIESNEEFVKSPSKELILKVSQWMVNYAENNSQFSNEERQAYIKVRDRTLYSLLNLKPDCN